MIYIFDLDGTLSFSGHHIDSSIVQAIKKLEKAGQQVIFASARPIRDMLPLLKDDFAQNFTLVETAQL